MNRVKVTGILEIDDDGEPVTGVVGWFDRDKATSWNEETYWDGNNHVSKATWNQWDHETLYRTAQGRWVLNWWSQYQGTQESVTYASDDKARQWLLANDYDDAVEQYFGPMEPERGPGRPVVGGRVEARLGDLLPQVDEWATQHGVTRAEAIRLLVADSLKAKH